MTLTEAISARRSVRAFTDRKLSRDEIEALLTAATLAPSACNMQSWHFYAVVDPTVRQKFSDVCAAWATTAPVLFVICTDKEHLTARFGERFGDKINTFVTQDTALAAENLLLKATDMGLGGCFMGAFDKDKCRAVLDIPEKYDIVALIPIGEPTENVPAKERKELDEVATII